MNFKESLAQELNRIDSLSISKRHEKVIEGFTQEMCSKALINGKAYVIFNSNDYLGLRFNPAVITAEEEGTKKYGTGPGAVRFISGTLDIHKRLEQAIAQFHGREDALLFSSAFSTNLSVMHALLKGQSADSLISSSVLIISDELNHRSIIEGIRVAGLEKQQKAVFKHMDYTDLETILKENKGKWSRAVIVTDGIFSMLGEAQNIRKIRALADTYDEHYPEGIIVIIDDAHGVGCFGDTGRGCEEVFGAHADLLVGTLGKAFGVEGGYVTGDKVLIDYLRESAASYIYSNPISGGNAEAGLASITLMNDPMGETIRDTLRHNIAFFKQKARDAGLRLAADSEHPIQPLLIGDAHKSRMLVQRLFEDGFLVTSINYPIVPKGRDEIRVQLSALHGQKEIEQFIDACARHLEELHRNN